MAFITIPPGDVDQGSVVDEALMSGKVKNDLDDLNARVVTLEALSGGGSVPSSDAKELFATIIAGGEDNVAKLWKVRHHIMMSSVGAKSEKDVDDFEQKSIMDRFFYDPNFTVVSQMSADAQAYMTNQYFIEQNEQMQFKIKKGENFFWIGGNTNTGNASVWRVYVDGVNANTYGLVDENGVTVASSFSSNTATLQWGRNWQFYGLDGEEHIITIKNENASALEVNVQYIDVGYKSPDFAIDHTVKLNAGAAIVGGISTDFEEGLFSFTKPTEGLANGYTGMLKVAQSGTVTAVDGISPAATQVKPNENLAFSSGPVTSIPVKNHYAFPLTGGICMFTHPSGETYLFSYGSKTQSGGPQTQTLANILWQAQPTEDFRPLPPAAGATYNTNEFRGDGRIELWAKAPIEISGTNNKIDFEITINGVTTSHSATVASGFYSADLVRIGKAVVAAMKTAKTLPANHEYFFEYNSLSQLWSIGVRGDQISKIDFLWASGANSGTSFKTVPGFTSDSTTKTSYIAPVVKQHLARRVFYTDDNMRSAEHPSIKYRNTLHTTAPTSPEADALLDRLNLSAYRRMVGFPSSPWVDIYPDEDACGMTLSFMRDDIAGYIYYYIDEGDATYLVQLDRPTDSAEPTVGALVNAFISFPRGSKKISFRFNERTRFQIEANTTFLTFFGYKQWFTKPQWETLNLDEKILKTVEVNGLRLFGTLYGHNTALYSPGVSNDNINTIAETGVWAQTTVTQDFNQRCRRTTAVGAYVEIEFVLVGDGGGIGMMTTDFSTSTQETAVFLSNAAIVEGTDLIEVQSTDYEIEVFDKFSFLHLGLKAGTYKCRIKNEHAAAMSNHAIFIVDTVEPQANAYTHTELANAGQGVAFALNVRRRNIQRYSAFKRPSYLTEGVSFLGSASMVDYLTTTHTEQNYDDSIEVSRDGGSHYFSSMNLVATGTYFQMAAFCRSIQLNHQCFSAHTTSVTPSVDGTNFSTVNTTECVKGGLAPSLNRSTAVRLFNKKFEYACAHSASLTFTMADTRGLRDGQKAILQTGAGATEEVYVTNIVTNVSFDIKKALGVIAAATVTKIFFGGFHNLKMTSGNATTHRASAFEYEPLPLEWSVIEARVLAESKEEIKESTQSLGSVGAGGVGVFVYQHYQQPIHSDGEEASPNETEIILTNAALTSTDTLDRKTKTFKSGANAALGAKIVTVQSRKTVSVMNAPRVRG